MLNVVDEEVMDILREVVAENPDYIYRAPPVDPPHVADRQMSCLYVHTDADGSNPRPGCVAGHVMYRLGIPLDTLKRWEGVDALSLMQEFTDADKYTREALDVAQTRQDAGATWAQALHAAEKACGLE
ncbi:hypothetical protein LHJ74_30770 [Streptomyces sp. N2-109]|uniref:Uncharacterized protein n=1 Tax=Streptomyces gossypii TaxID=2883101 RepID=A0ABT2K240_9ACTN|nr:hypothetical protein [Streptomyces gossypii]MCT2594240.1 hypothetical protein [Streptomyces gossypii]